MATGQHSRITGLYHAALERPPGERDAFLDAACADDPTLRHEVESLLRYSSDAGPFLASPAIQPAADRSTGMIGRQLGPYRIVSPLGAGGMGEVYRAHDSKLGRDVAIKRLPPLFTADPERRARFAREARLLATLNHPHIGAIYGLEDTDGDAALVLELVEGPTLAQRLDGGPLPIGEALAIARQVADALDAAHQKHIIHRDLKPGNIVLQGGIAAPGDPRVKVLDFGLATAVDPGLDPNQVSSTNQRTEAGRILGTPAYMSPEQARGLPVDKRTDIWAFGCVLFEMLTGRTPFGGGTVTDTLARILEREPDWTLLPGTTSPSIRLLLTRCLRKDPAKRLHDIADARIEIDERDLLVAQAPVSATAGAGLLKWGAAAMLGLLALAAGALWVSRAPAAPAEAVTFTIGPPPDASLGNRNIGFAVAPNGRYLALIASSGGRVALWLRVIGTGEYRKLEGTEGAIFPFWKPDSLEIGYFAGEALHTIRLSGGSPFRVTEGPSGFASEGGATWSRDDIIVFKGRSDELQKVSARGGVPLAVTKLAEGDASHRWPSFLPDGQHFLYLAHKESGLHELRVGSVDGTIRPSLGQFESNAIYSAGHLLFLSGGRMVARRFDTSRHLLSGEPFSVEVNRDQLISKDGFGTFSVSQSGLLAAHRGTSSGGSRLTWIDRSGTAGNAITDSSRVFLNLDVSRDGTRAAASAVSVGMGNIDIWAFDLARNDNGLRLTRSAAGEFDPGFSPDGRDIAFSSNRSAGHYSLLRQPSDGSGREETLVTVAGSVSGPDWSPDGRYVVYTGHKGLWLHPLVGGQLARPLLPGEFFTNGAAISPDGKWIAYSSNSSGFRFEIYVRSFPSGENQRRISVDGGQAPRWRGDGRELFFLAPDSAMMASTVDMTTGVISIPQRLFSTGLVLSNQKPYAVAPDGKRFLIPVPIDPHGTPPITMLLNWQSRIPKS